MANNSVVVSKEFSFDAAHQLVGHNGKCANIHGHTYKLQVKLGAVPFHGENRSDSGMVMDFYDLKQTINKLIVDHLDHAFIAHGDEPLLDAMIASGTKVVVLGFRTTCENMVRYICWKLLCAGMPVHSIRLYETPSGYAEFYAKDLDVYEGPNYDTICGSDLDD